ncbi:MAG: anaerobic ribonucleoside-triphosphate reductase, partial [Clostridia bacterium]
DKEGCVPYYTNSSNLPVDFTADIFEALDIQDDIQTLYTSGTVFHAFLGQKLNNWQAAANLVKKIADNYKLPYYTLSPTYSICQQHGYLEGEQKTCPVCGRVTEVYSRITGYYRPVQNWNVGKTAEYGNRKTYDIDSSVLKRHGGQCADACCAAPTIPSISGLLLFTTKTCPNCKMAKAMLEAANIPYTAIDAEDDKATTQSYGVKKAPTLLVPNNDGFDRFENASFIKKFVEGYKA